MPSKKQYKVGDRIQISLNGRILDATITAVVEHTDGAEATGQLREGSHRTHLRVAGGERLNYLRDATKSYKDFTR